MDPKRQLMILGLLVAMPGYYALALFLYMIIRPDPNNSWGSTYLYFFTINRFHDLASDS
jgi:hypothetical protein